MGLSKQTQEESKDCLEKLEDTPGVFRDPEGKDLTCIAMSSYYLLYR